MNIYRGEKDGSEQSYHNTRRYFIFAIKKDYEKENKLKYLWKTILSKRNDLKLYVDKNENQREY